MFDLHDCFFVKGFQALGHPNFDAIEFKKKRFFSKMSTGEYNTIVVFQLGSGGRDKAFFDPEMKAFLSVWVKRGGTLIMQGENSITKVFQEWFDLPWNFHGDYYRRTSYVYNTLFDTIPHVGNEIETFVGTKAYSVKACMISDVADNHRLYQPREGATVQSVIPLPGFAGEMVESGMCPLAVAQCGRGRVAFIGDVNAEPTTMKWIYFLGVLPSRADYCWMRKKEFLIALYGSNLLKLQSKAEVVVGREEQVGEVNAITIVFQDTNLVQYIGLFL